jgi:hypothetical protein
MNIISRFPFRLDALINDDTLIALDQALKDAGHDDVTIWGENRGVQNLADYSGGDKSTARVLKTRVSAPLTIKDAML